MLGFESLSLQRLPVAAASLVCAATFLLSASASAGPIFAATISNAAAPPPKRGAAKENVSQANTTTLRAKSRALLEKNLGAAKRSNVMKRDARTVDALEAALLAARELAPLRVRKAVVVATPPTALGVYRPSDGGRLVKRQLKLYVEVDNFRHTKIQTDSGAEPLYEVHLDVTGVFFLEDGQELGQKSLGTHRFETRSPTGRTWLGLDVQLGDAVPPGTYQVEIEVTDRATEKKSSRRVSFQIS